MDTVRVLIVQHNPVLAQSLETLLRADCRLHVVTSQAGDLSSLMHAVAEHQPEVVVICDHLGSQGVVAHLLERLPALRLIVINEDNNWMQVFQKKDVLLRNSPDLLQLIHAP